MSAAVVPVVTVPFNGRRGTQLAVVIALVFGGRLRVCKWRDSGRRFTQPMLVDELVCSPAQQDPRLKRCQDAWRLKEGPISL